MKRRAKKKHRERSPTPPTPAATEMARRLGAALGSSPPSPLAWSALETARTPFLAMGGAA